MSMLPSISDVIDPDCRSLDPPVDDQWVTVHPEPSPRLSRIVDSHYYAEAGLARSNRYRGGVLVTGKVEPSSRTVLSGQSNEV